MACKMRLRYMCFRSYQFHYNAAVSGRKKSQRYKNLSVKIKERLWIKVKTVDIWKNVDHLLINNSRKKKTPVRLHMPAGREYQGRHERGEGAISRIWRNTPERRPWMCTLSDWKIRGSCSQDQPLKQWNLMPGNKDIIQFGITQKVSLSDQIEIAFNSFEEEGLDGFPWGKMCISGILSKVVFCFTLFQEQVCTCTNLLVLYVDVHSMTYVPSLYRIILIVICFIFYSDDCFRSGYRCVSPY